MNLKRFTARTSREALAMVRHAFGEDAVVMSTKPCPEGVEVLAMAPESVLQIERVGATLAVQSAPAPAPVPAPTQVRSGKSFAERAARVEPSLGGSVDDDVTQLAMSTLSFQDYVRERMLKRRKAELTAPPQDGRSAGATAPVSLMRDRVASNVSQHRALAMPSATPVLPVSPDLPAVPASSLAPLSATASAPPRAAEPRVLPVLRDEVRAAAPRVQGSRERVQEPLPSRAPLLADTEREQNVMMTELRSMRGLIEQRFGALAFMEKLQRQPRHATLTHKLLECGFSPSLIRRLAESLPAEGDAMSWAANVLERNLATREHEAGVEDGGGTYALIGSTGVGKTTSTAKLAAAFAAKHGAQQLGLITLDAYRVGAHEQLRTYGRILGVPVHTAHDRASLEDLLDLLSAKKLVLIDTAGMAQRDTRTRELLDMLSHARVQRLLVMNAAAQGETFEDVVGAYGAATCAGVILSKIDEAVKLGPALDVLIRHKLTVLAVGSGQRVPEDWHRLSANALVQRALRSRSAPAWRFDSGDVNLVFAGVTHPAPRSGASLAQAH